jgi:putative membrane protein
MAQQMTEQSDPRVYFAAERTLLAWLRSGITVIGLGFVVARFGLFLRVMQNARANANLMSTIIGVALVLLGAVAIAAGAIQHVRFCRRLDATSRPSSYAMLWAVWFAGTLSAIGVILAVHLLVRASSS